MDRISFSTIQIDIVGSSQKSAPNDSCVYLISEKELAILIDAGAGGQRSIENIKRNISEIVPLELIEYILVTHSHIDHIGGLKGIKSYLPQAKIIAHPYASEVIINEDSILSAANWYNTRLEAVAIDIISPNYEVQLNGGLFQVIPTPGHTPGSVVGLLSVEENGKRILFGQDIHGPFMPAWKSDIVQWRQSMEKIISLDLDYLCEGHFGIIQGKDAVRDFIEGYIKNMF